VVRIGSAWTNVSDRDAFMVPLAPWQDGRSRSILTPGLPVSSVPAQSWTRQRRLCSGYGSIRVVERATSAINGFLPVDGRAR
jgi:hypothetical protein